MGALRIKKALEGELDGVDLGTTTKAKFEGHRQHEEEENRVLRAQPEGGHVKPEVDRFGTKKEEEEDPPCPA